MWDIIEDNTKKSKERKIEKFLNVVDSNKERINDLEITNASLMDSMVLELKGLLELHFGLNSRLINNMIDEHPWNAESIDQIRDRLIAYYNLEVEVTGLSTLGFTPDVYYILFTYNDIRYQLSIPNLISIDNYYKCYGGTYGLHYERKKNVWDFVKGVDRTCFLDELVENFKKSVGYKL